MIVFKKFLQLLEDFFDSSAFSSFAGVTSAHTGQSYEMEISQEASLKGETYLENDCRL